MSARTRPDLAALLMRDPVVADVSQVASTAPLHGPVLRMVPITLLQPNPQQARKIFAAGPLNDLAGSIRAVGIRQPLLLSPLQDGSGRYLIHAGERRFRAALLAGLSDVPSMIVPASPDGAADAIADSLLENLQRVGLDPLEEAEAFGLLQQEYGLSTRDIARRIGKSQSYVAERLVAHKRLAPAVKQVIIEALAAHEPIGQSELDDGVASPTGSVSIAGGGGDAPDWLDAGALPTWRSHGASESDRPGVRPAPPPDPQDGVLVPVRAHHRVLHRAARRPLGHAIRKLLSALREPAQVEAVREIAARGLSVREAQHLIRARFRPVQEAADVGGAPVLKDQVAADGLAVVKLVGLGPASRGRFADRTLLIDALRQDLADLQALS